jgi:hypothetical protein
MTCRRLLPRKVCIRQTFALTFHGNLVEIGKGCAQGAKQIGFLSAATRLAAMQPPIAGKDILVACCKSDGATTDIVYCRR